jgi:hypothetical protein
MKEGVAYKRMLSSVSKTVFTVVGRYLDKVKRELVNKMQICKCHAYLMAKGLPTVTTARG